MGVEFLVHAVDSGKAGSAEKGNLCQAMFNSGHVWGTRERLPWYIQVHVTNAVAADILPYAVEWTNSLDVIDEGATLLLRAQLLTKPNWVRLDSQKRTKIRNFLSSNGYDIDSIELVSNVGIRVPALHTVQELESLINDTFTHRHEHRRYYVNHTVINNQIALNNDRVEITLNQFTNNIIDRLD